MARNPSRLVWVTATTGAVLALSDPLVAGTVYYADLSGAIEDVFSVHLRWDAAIIVTATFDLSNDPTVSLYNAATGEWYTEPSLGSIVALGGAAGGKVNHVAASGAFRTRLVATVGGTGGQLVGYRFGKES